MNKITKHYLLISFSWVVKASNQKDKSYGIDKMVYGWWLYGEIISLYGVKDIYFWILGSWEFLID